MKGGELGVKTIRKDQNHSVDNEKSREFSEFQSSPVQPSPVKLDGRLDERLDERCYGRGCGRMSSAPLIFML